MSRLLIWEFGGNSTGLVVVVDDAVGVGAGFAVGVFS